MEVLPNEILEIIALKMDGESLVRFKRSCRRFSAVARRVETVFSAWRRRCLSEIAEDVFTEIALPGHPQRMTMLADESFDWQDVYQRWYGQRCMTNDKVTISKQFDMFDTTEPSNRNYGCTCITLSGNRLMTGHNDGEVHKWNCLTGAYMYPLVQHMRNVVDMSVINFFNLQYSTEYFVDVDHHHLLTVGLDNTVKTVPLFGRPFLYTYRPRVQTQLQQARVFRNKVALLCSAGRLELLLMDLILAGPADIGLLQLVPIMTLSTGLPHPRGWISFWNNKIIALNLNLDRCCVSVPANDELPRSYSCHPPSLVQCQNDTSTAGDLSVVAASLFRDKITILRTVSRRLCIAVDGVNYRVYTTMKDLGGYITAITIEGNLLLVGTEFGALYLYYLKDDEDLMNLKFDKPIWTGKLSGGRAISHVDINLTRLEPSIVACNSWSVIVVKWIKAVSAATAPVN